MKTKEKVLKHKLLFGLLLMLFSVLGLYLFLNYTDLGIEYVIKFKWALGI